MIQIILVILVGIAASSFADITAQAQATPCTTEGYASVLPAQRVDPQALTVLRDMSRLMLADCAAHHQSKVRARLAVQLAEHHGDPEQWPLYMDDASSVMSDSMALRMRDEGHAFKPGLFGDGALKSDEAYEFFLASFADQTALLNASREAWFRAKDHEVMAFSRARLDTRQEIPLDQAKVEEWLRELKRAALLRLLAKSD